MSETENAWALLVAFGLIIGSTIGVFLFVFTQQAWYIGIGAGLGLVLGAVLGLNQRKTKVN